jgi:hypothetical protein
MVIMTAINLERGSGVRLVPVDAAAVRARDSAPVAVDPSAGSSCLAGAAVRQGRLSRMVSSLRDAAAVVVLVSFVGVMVVGAVAVVAAFLAI